MRELLHSVYWHDAIWQGLLSTGRLNHFLNFLGRHRAWASGTDMSECTLKAVANCDKTVEDMESALYAVMVLSTGCRLQSMSASVTWAQ